MRCFPQHGRCSQGDVSPLTLILLSAIMTHSLQVPHAHFSKGATADAVVACIQTAPLHCVCLYKSGRVVPLALGDALPVLPAHTSMLPHTIDIVVECGSSIAITSASFIFVYNRDAVLSSGTGGRSDDTSVGSGGSNHAEQPPHAVASSASLPHAPSSACALSGCGGAWVVSCGSKLVVVMQRDYRIMAAHHPTCHHMAAAGESLLVTVANDGVLRIMRVYMQQQHVLLHLIWAGDRYHSQPLFGCLQTSTTAPSAVCLFLPDASVLRLSVCEQCDSVAVVTVAEAPKRCPVVVAVAASASCELSRTAVMFDDGRVSVWCESDPHACNAPQTHVVAFNSQLRLLGLYDRWLLLCDGSSLRLFDCGAPAVKRNATGASASLALAFPSVIIRPRASQLAAIEARVVHVVVAAEFAPRAASPVAQVHPAVDVAATVRAVPVPSGPQGGASAAKSPRRHSLRAASPDAAADPSMPLPCSSDVAVEDAPVAQSPEAVRLLPRVCV